MATIEAVTIERSRGITLQVSIARLVAATIISLEGAKARAEETTLALRNLGPIVAAFPRIGYRSVPNPRAPIPDSIRRAGRQRWQ